MLLIALLRDRQQCVDSWLKQAVSTLRPAWHASLQNAIMKPFGILILALTPRWQIAFYWLTFYFYRAFAIHALGDTVSAFENIRQATLYDSTRSGWLAFGRLAARAGSP